MQKKEFFKQTIETHLAQEKEAIRRAVLLEEGVRRPAGVRTRRALWIGVAACTCAAIILGVSLMRGEPPAAPLPVQPEGESAATIPLSRAFSLKLCFDGGSAPVQHSVDLKQPCNRFFWADEQETARLREEMDKGNLNTDDSGRTHLHVSYHQDYFRRPENFISLQTSWLEIQGDDLHSIRLQCANGEVSYFHPAIQKEYREKYPDAESLEQTVMEKEGFASPFRLPWRQRGSDITLTEEQLSRPQGFLELQPTGLMWQAMLKEEGYSYEDWADTVRMTVTYTDGTVEEKTLRVVYDAEGYQRISFAD